MYYIMKINENLDLMTTGFKIYAFNRKLETQIGLKPPKGEKTAIFSFSKSIYCN